MKHLNKRISMLASLSLAAAVLLSACGGASQEGGVSAPPDAAPASAASTGAAEPAGLPHYNITAILNTATEDINGNPFYQQLAQEAQVDITFECVQSDWSTKKAALLASNSLPDAFIGWQCLTNADVSNNTSMFASLQELISAENTPNLKTFIERDSTYKNVITDMNGGIYFLSDRMLFRPETYTSLQMNTAWLEKLGLEVPTTTEAFENVLKAFRDQDPNGNGQKDEIPCYIQLTGDDAWSIRCFMGAFDCAASINSLFALDGGKVVYQPVTENYKKFVTWIAHLREEGLMPAELATADWSQFSARLGSDEPIVGVTNCWVKDPLNIAYQDQYTAIAPLEGPEGHRYIAGNMAVSSYDGVPKFVMSANCENKEALMGFVDLFFLPINAAQAQCGPIGTTLTQDGDGKLSFIEPPEGMDWDTWSYKYAISGGVPSIGGPDVENLFTSPNPPNALKLEIDKLNQPYVKPNSSLPNLKFTEEESQELSIIQTDVDTYVDSSLVEWFANGNVENTWDNYLSELQKMKVDRYIEIYQAAYDRQK